MPHLQSNKDGSEKDGTEPPTQDTPEKPEADIIKGGDRLLSLASTASQHAAADAAAATATAVKESVVAEGSAPSNDTDETGSSIKNGGQSTVTPSPFTGAPPSSSYDHPPPFYGRDGHPSTWMGPSGSAVYDHHRPVGPYGSGARRLFPSPIRFNNPTNGAHGEEDEKQDVDGRYPYGGPARPFVPAAGHGMLQYPTYPPRQMDDHYSKTSYAPQSPMKKRSQLSEPEEPSAPKRPKPFEEPSTDEREVKPVENLAPESGSQENDSPTTTGTSEAGNTTESKQRLISPASSVEVVGKSADEDSTENTDKTIHPESAESGSMVEYASRYPHPYPPPPDHRYMPARGHYPPPYYPPVHSMYGYPPPPPPAHFREGPPPAHAWRMPPGGSYPPPHGPPGAYPYPPSYGPPPPAHHARHAETKRVDSKSASSSGSNSPQRPSATSGGSKIKSVAEWQRAALATGRAPSANRCMPLKGPIPSKYWGEAEKTKDTPIPDFHQLVNYPDYLNKMRPNGSEPPGSANNGKRHCVMCGKLRVCSASTANLGGNVLRRPKKQDEGGDDEDENDNQIIPRQNKGLCTACDITVWVFVESGLEIKWCKGCKNFRPWAAFGDKGLATKCVRCRERQREKYALQKDELRLRRLRQSAEKQEEKKEDEQHAMAAAKGLQTLMAASTAVL